MMMSSRSQSTWQPTVTSIRSSGCRTDLWSFVASGRLLKIARLVLPIFAIPPASMVLPSFYRHRRVAHMFCRWCHCRVSSMPNTGKNHLNGTAWSSLIQGLLLKQQRYLEAPLNLHPILFLKPPSLRQTSRDTTTPATPWSTNINFTIKVKQKDGLEVRADFD